MVLGAAGDGDEQEEANEDIHYYFDTWINIERRGKSKHRVAPPIDQWQSGNWTRSAILVRGREWMGKSRTGLDSV